MSKIFKVNEKSVYDLELHEELLMIEYSDFCTTVMRVPGGWIYRSQHMGIKVLSTTFVPYSNEFNDNVDIFGVKKENNS